MKGALRGTLGTLNGRMVSESGLLSNPIMGKNARFYHPNRLINPEFSKHYSRGALNLTNPSCLP